MNTSTFPSNSTPYQILVESSTDANISAPIVVSLHYLLLVFLIFILMLANKFLSHSFPRRNSNTSSFTSNLSKFRQVFNDVKTIPSNVNQTPTVTVPINV